MIILDATNRLLEIKLGGAVTTNELPVVVSYVDLTTELYTPISNPTVTNGATPVTIAAAPAASTQRQIKFISVRNADTVSATVTIQYDDNTTDREIVVFALDANDVLLYTDGEGFRVVDSTGSLKTGGSASGTPGGADTQVQFNDGGSFGGDAGLTYNKTTNALTADSFIGALTGNASTVSTITGLAPDTATTQATQPNITSAALLPWTGLKPGTDGEIPTFDASGDPAFVAVGTADQVLTSNGAGAAPTMQDAAGGDVSKVGTPVDNQVGVWTGDGTIEGTTGLTYDGSTLTLKGSIAAVKDGGLNELSLTSHRTSAGTHCRFIGYATRGSTATPTGILSGDELFNMAVLGYHSSSGYTPEIRLLEAKAAEDFTNTANGNDLSFYTTPIGGTARTERMGITANGIINFNNQSSARVYLSADQTIATATTTKVELDTEVYDEQTEYDPTTNYRFTIKEAGTYLVVAQLTFLLLDSGKKSQAMIRVNGGTVAFNEQYSYTANRRTICPVLTMTQLALGDYIEVFAYQDNGGNLDLDAGNVYSWVSIQKVA